MKFKNLNSMQQSVLGNKEPIRFVPSTGFGQWQMTSKMVKLGEVPYKKAPKTLNEAIRLKSLNGVLPCDGGITHHVLRGPPPNPNNQQAPQGVARGQRHGLATNMDWEVHNISKNAPVLARASSQFRGQTSRLGSK
jgi:hypothetical protein